MCPLLLLSQSLNPLYSLHILDILLPRALCSCCSLCCKRSSGRIKFGSERWKTQNNWLKQDSSVFLSKESPGIMAPGLVGCSMVSETQASPTWKEPHSQWPLMVQPVGKSKSYRKKNGSKKRQLLSFKESLLMLPLEALFSWYSIAQNIVTWSHFASRNSGKCSIYSEKPWALPKSGSSIPGELYWEKCQKSVFQQLLERQGCPVWLVQSSMRLERVGKCGRLFLKMVAPNSFHSCTFMSLL